MDKVDRDLKNAENDGAVEVNELLPPIHAILMTLAAGGNKNTTPSLFEAKGGVRGAAVNSKPSKDAIEAIQSQSKSKKALKELAQHLRGQKYGVIPVKDLPFSRKLRKEIDAAYDSNVATRITLPESANWADKIRLFEFYGSERNIAVGMAPMCCIDCRIVLTGSEVILGATPSALQGSDLKEKRKCLYTMTVDQYSKLIDDGTAFVMVNDGSSLAMLPSGFLYAIASDSVTGLRWSCGSDEADLLRVRHDLGALLESFQELRLESTGYTQWYKWLQSL